MIKSSSQEKSLIRIYSTDFRTIGQYNLNMFSGGDKFNPKPNIHTSYEVARNCGLTSTIVTGAITEGLVCELLRAVFGEVWYQTGKLNIKFIKKVLTGESIKAFAVWENSKYVEVWCENHTGEKVAIGTASLKKT